MVKSKYTFGTRAAGVLWDATQNTTVKDLRGAIQTAAGGIVARIKTGTRNGSGVMDANIEDSDDGVNFNAVASFTQITAAGSYSKDPARPLRRFVRLATTLTSGTSFSACQMWFEYREDRSSGAPAGGVTET